MLKLPWWPPAAKTGWGYWWGCGGTVFAKEILDRKVPLVFFLFPPPSISRLHNLGPVPSVSCPRFHTGSPRPPFDYPGSCQFAVTLPVALFAQA